jgi:hypothetical protein
MRNARFSVATTKTLSQRAPSSRATGRLLTRPVARYTAAAKLTSGLVRDTSPNMNPKLRTLIALGITVLCGVAVRSAAWAQTVVHSSAAVSPNANLVDSSLVNFATPTRPVASCPAGTGFVLLADGVCLHIASNTRFLGWARLELANYDTQSCQWSLTLRHAEAFRTAGPPAQTILYTSVDNSAWKLGGTFTSGSTPTSQTATFSTPSQALRVSFVVGYSTASLPPSQNGPTLRWYEATVARAPLGVGCF